MPQPVRIVFGIIGLVLIVYVAILGMTEAFNWFDPGGGSGRMARLATGVIIGLGLTVGVIAWRRFRGK
jgi:hypothetical protein